MNVERTSSANNNNNNNTNQTGEYRNIFFRAAYEIHKSLFGAETSAAIPQVQVGPPSTPPPPPLPIPVIAVAVPKTPTEELIELLEKFKMPYSDPTYFFSLIETCEDEQRFEAQMETIACMKNYPRSSEIAEVRQEVLTLRTWVKKLEENPSLVDFTKLNGLQLDLLLEGTTDEPLLKTIAPVLKAKVLEKPIIDLQNRDEWTQFVDQNYFIDPSTMDHLMMYGEITKEELPELMRHLTPRALVAPTTVPMPGENWRGYRGFDLIEYRGLVHDVLKKSSHLYRHALMNLLLVTERRISEEMIATRLAWAIHEDPELAEQLCSHKSEWYATRNLIAHLQFEIENVKRYKALEKVTVDRFRYQNEYTFLNSLSRDEDCLKQVNAQNAKTVMEGLHWTVLIKDPQVFKNHGHKPQAEVLRQMPFKSEFELSQLTAKEKATLSEMTTSH